MKRIIIQDLKILRQKCLPVISVDNIEGIIQDLKDTLQATAGWGLSANQIGYNKAISYVRVPNGIDQQAKKFKYNEYILINPIIQDKDNKILVKNEGCLSFPGLHVTTQRYTWLVIDNMNEKLEVNTLILKDYNAIAAQHEIDHVNGIVIMDRKYRDVNRRK